MTARPRLGVVGLGDFGLEHLAGALDGADFDVVAVADPRGAHADAVADRYGVELRFPDGFALLTDAAVDAIAVVSPSSTHLALAEAAVGCGVAVLLEKPVVEHLAEASRLAALDDDGLVVPAHILRSAVPHIELREFLVREGARIGALSAHRHRGIDHLERFPDVDPVLMSMVHDIDLAIWLTGSRAVYVRAHGHAVRDPSRVDTVLATVIDDRGRTWALGSSWTVESDGPGDCLELYTDRGLRVVEGAAVDLSTAMRAQYRSFAAALAGAAPVVTVADAVHGIAVAEAIRLSMDLGGAEVEVSDVDTITPAADTVR